MKIILGLIGLTIAFVPDFSIQAIESSPECRVGTSQFKHNQPCTITQNITQNTLETQAQQFYEQGNFTESALLLERAIATYADRGDRLGMARALRNLGLVHLKSQNWQQAQLAISNSLTALKELLKEQPNAETIQQLQASTLDAQGQLQLLTSYPEQALETWKIAGEIHQKTDNWTGWIRSQINQAQALQSLGLYSQSLKKLVAAEQQLSQQSDSLLKAKALQSLGDVLREVGRLETSQTALEKSLALAKQFQDTEQTAISLISLGNTARLAKQFEPAVNFYQMAFQISSSPELKLQAHLNQLSILVDQQQVNTALDLLSEIEFLLKQLSASSVKVQGQINLAQSLINLSKINPTTEHTTEHPRILAIQIADYLTDAIQMAKILGDKRNQAYGLGLLGNLYEHNQQFSEAQQLTEKALILAQEINATDIAYRWQWQLGRVLNRRNNRTIAISAYTQAMASLQSLRSDIVAIGSDIQFDFRAQVEPVYRELAGLLLEGEPSQENLKQARNVLESLQVAELDNFFRDACLDVKPVNVENIDAKAAIFYTILLPDRLEVIVTLPNQSLIHHRINLSQTEIEGQLQELQEAITVPRKRVFIENFLEPSQRIYDWLVRPVENGLQMSKIQTLVFILDGKMRSIPVASLYDGENYLVEKYGVAIAPGLQLTDLSSAQNKQKINVLGGGLSVGRQGFPPLPAVEEELEQIRRQVGRTKTLLNETFTELQVNSAIAQNPYTIIHLATHGEFSSNAENTFVLTWDERINIEELRRLLSADSKQINPIELIILSACQTASGDNRAGLGLAGMAVRAGARSTIASLWSVDDQSTALLMSNFYQELNKVGTTKSEALRYAQQQLLQEKEFSHPYFWSAFVLVGNWL
ncbi:MAG: CHAT domain-containing protein [Microcoleaceae cyanobacterium]